MNLTRMQRVSRGALASALLVFGSAVTLLAPTAHAAPLVTGLLCLRAASSECIVAHGASNQVTIQSSGYSNFTSSSAGTYGGFAMENFADGNGNCLRENNSQQVVIANGRCLSSDSDAKWIELSGGAYENYGHLVDNNSVDFMGTYNDVSGKPVWAQNGVTYTSWNF